MSARSQLAATPGLDTVAARVRSSYERVQHGHLEAVEGYLETGHALLEARESLPGDTEFGRWFSQQNFGFSRVWAWKLREAARHEERVRAALVSQLTGGHEPSLEKALRAVRDEQLGDVVLDEPESVATAGTYRTIVADPPWKYGNTATRGSAEDHYPTMPVEDICALPVGEWTAGDGCHLYLWTTNNFLREAFQVVEAWGFEYKTCLTWVKRQIGLGNYFRSRTEHVLFCTSGSVPTARRDVANVIEAPRGRHSRKPDCFMDLVEEMSPAPRLEMFSRRRRLGWSTWGNES